MELYNEYILKHYGVKGQKWGVRRYQNKDGSLTAEGKARLSEKAGYYMNPNRDDKNVTNRHTVSKEYTDSYNNLLRKHGIDPDNASVSAMQKKTDKGETILDLDAKMFNSYLDKYADATLDDLVYEKTAAARDYVKQLFSKDLAPMDNQINNKKQSIFW